MLNLRELLRAAVRSTGVVSETGSSLANYCFWTHDFTPWVASLLRKTFLFPSVPVVFQVFSPRTPQRYLYSWCILGLGVGDRSHGDKLVFEVNLFFMWTCISYHHFWGEWVFEANLSVIHITGYQQCRSECLLLMSVNSLKLRDCIHVFNRVVSCYQCRRVFHAKVNGMVIDSIGGP